MIIADTSALVLNWTSKETWKSKNARDYFDGLDLSAADTLYKMFDKELDLIQCHLLSNRKFFVRKCVIEFLEQFKIQQVNAQVIILAAGIDPLSIEVASLYPDSVVFDVDKYSMKEKEKYLNHVCANIKFIECDITNIELLEASLVEKGWDKNQPGILIMEGITYYLTENELRNILTFFAKNISNLVCDFGLKPECVDEPNRKHGIEIKDKIKKSVGLEFMNCYEPDYYMNLVKQCGFKNPVRFTTGDIQIERTGDITPFEGIEPAWVALVKC
jgi:O-methyltransferase involved in polyketide biosynthesis